MIDRLVTPRKVSVIRPVSYHGNVIIFDAVDKDHNLDVRVALSGDLATDTCLAIERDGEIPEVVVEHWRVLGTQKRGTLGDGGLTT